MFYNFVVGLVRLYLHIIYRIRVVGEENVPKDGGLIICSNHRSNMDPVLIGCFTMRRLNFMAKKSLLKVPVLGFILKHLGVFPVNRNIADISAIKASFHVLKNNGALNMYPEGKRSKDGKLHPFKSGASMIALKSGAKILPACVRGNYKLFSKMEIVFGQPIDPKNLVNDSTDESIEKVNNVLYESIKSLLGEE